MGPDEPETAGEAITRVLVSLSRQLVEQEQAVARAEEDAVHQARIRVRRIRSVLAVYRRILDTAETTRLRQTLRMFGAELGSARDPEVRAKTMEDLLQARTAPDVIDAVEALVDRSLAEYADAREKLLRVFESPEHRALLAWLEAFAANPPFGERSRRTAGKPAGSVFSQAIRREVARVDERARAAATRDMDALHELRKKARRLRYAANAMSSEPYPVLGARARAIGDAAEDAQNILGDHRDGLLLAAHLRHSLSDHALSRSASTGIGRFAARCERRAIEELAELGPALDAIHLAFSADDRTTIVASRDPQPTRDVLPQAS